jgi:hypothetical protein
VALAQSEETIPKIGVSVSLISDAMSQIRQPGVIDDDAKLKEVLTGIFKAGQRQFARNEQDASDSRGMLMFNDGKMVSI